MPRLSDIKKRGRKPYSTEKPGLRVKPVWNGSLYRQCGVKCFRSFWNRIFPPFLLWIKSCTLKTIEIITRKGGRWTHRGMQSLWTFFVFCPYFSSGSSTHCILLGPYKQFIARALRQWETSNFAWMVTKWSADGTGPRSSCPVVAVASGHCPPLWARQKQSKYRTLQGRKRWKWMRTRI